MNTVDRILSARAAKLKYKELDALIHELPDDHPSRAAMRHALSKLWMFSMEAFGPEVENEIKDEPIKTRNATEFIEEEMRKFRKEQRKKQR